MGLTTLKFFIRSHKEKTLQLSPLCTVDRICDGKCTHLLISIKLTLSDTIITIFIFIPNINEIENSWLSIIGIYKHLKISNRGVLGGANWRRFLRLAKSFSMGLRSGL